MRSKSWALIGALLLLGGCGAQQAAAPVAAHPHPDFSGIWKIAKPVQQLLSTGGSVPPLLPEALKAYEQRRLAQQRGDTSFDTSFQCKPLGEPRSLYEQGWPFEILQSDDSVIFAYQANRMTRVVPFAASRGKLTGPWWYGDGIASWDGDALLIDVVDLKAQTLLDATGLPHSDNLHLTERFTLESDGRQLRVLLHFEDPTLYAAPWDAELVMQRQPDNAISEDVCIDRLGVKNYATLPPEAYPK
ncbi:MAG: hypothetical protein QM718_04030 [Steroidobacteraceae bacterium]